MIWKQPKCPSTKEDVIHIHNRILFGHKKEWKFAIYNNMDGLEGIMLGEICQTEKDKYCMISLICGIQKLTQTRDYSQKETDLQIWRGN